jgi:hypothetical protein
MSNLVIISGVLAGGCTYYPANGKNPAHIIGTIFDNDRTDSIALPFTAWNGNSASPGKGRADIIAKMAKGAHVTIEGTLDVYDGRIFKNGNPLMDANGQALTDRKMRIRVRSIKFHRDSNQQILDEITAWNNHVQTHGTMPPFSFTMRPGAWNIPGTQDEQIWRQIRDWRAAQIYQGGDVYGYAKIGAVTGTAVAAPTGNAVYQPGQVPTAPQVPGATATPQVPTAPQIPVNQPTPATPATPQVPTGQVPTAPTAPQVPAAPAAPSTGVVNPAPGFGM